MPASIAAHQGCTHAHPVTVTPQNKYSITINKYIYSTHFKLIFSQHLDIISIPSPANQSPISRLSRPLRPIDHLFPSSLPVLSPSTSRAHHHTIHPNETWTAVKWASEHNPNPPPAPAKIHSRQVCSFYCSNSREKNILYPWQCGDGGGGCGCCCFFFCCCQPATSSCIVAFIMIAFYIIICCSSYVDDAYKIAHASTSRFRPPMMMHTHLGCSRSHDSRRLLPSYHHTRSWGSVAPPTTTIIIQPAYAVRRGGAKNNWLIYYLRHKLGQRTEILRKLFICIDLGTTILLYVYNNKNALQDVFLKHLLRSLRCCWLAGLDGWLLLLSAFIPRHFVSQVFLFHIPSLSHWSELNTVFYYFLPHSIFFSSIVLNTTLYYYYGFNLCWLALLNSLSNIRLSSRNLLLRPDPTRPTWPINTWVSLLLFYVDHTLTIFFNPEL